MQQCIFLMTYDLFLVTAYMDGGYKTTVFVDFIGGREEKELENGRHGVLEGCAVGSRYLRHTRYNLRLHRSKEVRSDLDDILYLGE